MDDKLHLGFSSPLAWWICNQKSQLGVLHSQGWGLMEKKQVDWLCGVLFRVGDPLRASGVSRSVVSDSLWPSMDYSPPGSSVHRFPQVTILEWVAILFSRGSSWPRDWTQVSSIAGRFFTIWVIREGPSPPLPESFKMYCKLENEIHHGLPPWCLQGDKHTGSGEGTG